MKLLKRWISKTSQFRSVVTTYWLPEEVSIVLWTKSPDEQYVPGAAIRISDNDCNADSYVHELKRLLKDLQFRNIQKTWILPEEVFPSNYEGSGGEGQFVPLLPQWIQDCWSGLPTSILPEHVVSGLAAVRNNLLKWEMFKQPGTGYHLRLQNRSLFFGFSAESIQTRVSRTSLISKDKGGLNVDWLRQTQGLYKSRSGHQLRRILISEPVTERNTLGVSSEMGVDVVHAGFPVDSFPVEKLGVSPAIVYLHSCGLLDSSRRVSRLSLKLLEGKRSREQWGHRFRGACALLLIGWVCSLLGACRSQPIHVENDSSGYLEWEGQRRMWEMKHSEWQSGQDRWKSRMAPFSLAGSVARSLPDEMELERLNIRESEKKSAYMLEMDGNCKDPAAASVFRGWLDSMRDDQAEFVIKNLKVYRSNNVMNFRLRALVNKGEF